MKKIYALGLLLPLLLVSCSEKKQDSSLSKSQFDPEVGYYIANLSSSGDNYYTEAQFNYLNNDNPTDTTPYNGNMSVSAPLPKVLSWDGNLDEYKVNIYSDDYLQDLVVSYVTSENSFEFYNGELEKNYYWTVSSVDGTLVSECSDLFIARQVTGPRNLKIDGVENIRDIGAWEINDGGEFKKLIKQGMIYRSGRFNEEKVDTINPTITEEGLYEVNNHLKIKTEIDLRRTGTNEVGALTDTSVLGEDVNYVQLPMIYEGQNILTYQGRAPRGGDDYIYDNPAKIKEFFTILSDIDNYPVNFHCSIGKDRTGCLAYLLEALMGFDEELLMRDYMFTNFANAGLCKPADITGTGRYVPTLTSYEHGDTLQEKVYNYLQNEVDISKATLDSVIDILKA